MPLKGLKRHVAMQLLALKNVSKRQQNSMVMLSLQTSKTHIRVHIYFKVFCCVTLSFGVVF